MQMQHNTTSTTRTLQQHAFIAVKPTTLPIPKVPLAKSISMSQKLHPATVTFGYDSEKGLQSELYYFLGTFL